MRNTIKYLVDNCTHESSGFCNFGQYASRVLPSINFHYVDADSGSDVKVERTHEAENDLIGRLSRVAYANSSSSQQDIKVSVTGSLSSGPLLGAHMQEEVATLGLSNIYTIISQPTPYT